jgi:anaerobic nitric oxide reductase transcription regulator
VPLLAAHFADVARRRLGLGPVRLSEAVRTRLAAADWPGNVRELENVVGRAVLRAAAGGEPQAAVTVLPAHLDVGSAMMPPRSEPVEPAHAPARPLAERVRDYQRRAIEEAVGRNGGSWAAAARELGMHRSNLHHLSGRLGIRRPSGTAARPKPR